MKKRYAWVYTTVLLLLALSPAVSTLVLGPSKAGANERLSKTPVLVDEKGVWNKDFLQDTANWFSDHFFFRQELISVGNRLSAKLFNTSGTDKVILGKDGWLFFEETMDDYTGLNGLTDRELFSLTNNLSLMSEYAENNDKEFLFVPAPNKNTLYPRFMPATGIVAETTDAQRLFAYLDKRNVPYVDLFTAFRKETSVLYFANDSHWNSQGAALAADCINKAFGVDSRYYSDSFAKKEAYTGDLYTMLYPAFCGREENPVYGGQLTYTFNGKATKPDSITLETTGQGTKKLLAYRDSFGNLLYPYLANSFGEARFSRSTVYDLTLDADCILLEITERNLDLLLKSPPVMPSPVRDVEIPEESKSGISVRSLAEKAPEGTQGFASRLYGPLDADARVYFVCEGLAYEAFLLEDNGFAGFLPSRPEAVLYTCADEIIRLSVE